MDVENTDGSGKYHNYVFTSYQEMPPDWLAEKMHFLAYQQEICPTTGKKHWQGYVEWKHQPQRSACQKLLGSVKNEFKKYTMYVNKRLGTQKQALEYVKKGESSVKGSFKEFGVMKDQGHRSELDSLFEACASGKTKAEILHEFGGKAFKHVNLIDRTIKILWGKDPVDNEIREYRAGIKKMCSGRAQAEDMFIEMTNRTPF